ncbi:heme ABC transporter ATP-binding protein [Flaviaesturariibacter aridisoli]|uniref:Heme ABC transporter ATP-binding protein n=1 Tax=Flaviaesturariibacter aridisoli TaxID=2545761 RepID=A0A4R4E805_9BACT|nr:heme ABC transporter ATP-binding protein [Flaviaesturariibacter aridisoli]TCZ73865.1 heme ABC transporter ATP-binding protein [Flaviaesturariibacter aridisoli]
MLETLSVQYNVGKKELLASTNLSFEAGRFHVIMGPNGAGKSTLLQLLAGELKPAAGTVTLDGADLRQYSQLELARRRAVLSQHYALQFPIAVREVVRLGRYPHAGSLSRAAEEQLIDNCLEALDMLSFTVRDYTTLSGGEAQKVQMARVLAQLGGIEATGKLLFLDEPVSHLDIRFQHRLLQAAKQLTDRGNTVVAVLHDVNLALRYADRLLFMKEAAVRYDLAHPGSLTHEILSGVFSVQARILRQEGHAPVVIFE